MIDETVRVVNEITNVDFYGIVKSMPTMDSNGDWYMCVIDQKTGRFKSVDVYWCEVVGWNNNI